MTKPGIQIRFDTTTKLYNAEEAVDGAIYGAFGATPEEAMARLELVKALTSSCELCRDEREGAGRRTADSFCWH